jgi:hypothetical protein
MKLLSLRVHNYRIHQTAYVEFDGSRTVIGGDNETGKSTLVEAAHNALFLRSRVTGSLARSLHSELHPGHPTVELRFESGGRAFTITKQFTGTTSASTTLQEAGGRTLHGEEAEARIHDICRAEEVSGGKGLESRLRAQWAHIFAWQGAGGADPVKHANEDAAARRLRERLGRLDGGTVLESPLDVHLARELTDRYELNFTDRGAPRAGSELSQAAEAVGAAESAVTAAATALTSLQEAIDTVDAATATIGNCEHRLIDAREEHLRAKQWQHQASLVAVAIAEQQHAAEAALAAFTALRKADLEIRQGESAAARLRESLLPAEQELAAIEAGEASGNARFASAMEAVNAAQRHQAEVNAHLQLLEWCEQHARLIVERVGLGGRCQRIADLRTDAAALRARRDALPAIDSDDVSELANLERDLDNARATLDAIATRIEVIRADHPVILGGMPLHSGGVEIITSPTDLEIGEQDRPAIQVRICPGGGRTLAETTHELERAGAALEARLRGLNVVSVSAARQDLAARQFLDAELLAKETAIDGLGGDQALREFAALEAETATVDAEIGRRSPASFTRPVTPLDVATRACEARAAQQLATERAASANAELAAAKCWLDELTTNKVRVETDIRTSRAALQAIEARVQVLIDEHGADRNLELVNRESASAQATARLAASREALAQHDPRAIDRDLARWERTIGLLLSEKQDAQTRLELARARLQIEGTNDPRDDLARAVSRRRAALDGREQARLRAESVRLLTTLFAQEKHGVEARFVGPLVAKVTDYLKLLYGPDCIVDVRWDGNRFEKLTVSRGSMGNVVFEFNELSGGAQEQVSAAFRLAMAEILAAEHDGCLPVVFDDSFVSTDPGRMRNLQRMLDLAASRGLQVIVLSCDPGRYAALGAATVRLPEPGRN